MDSQAPYQKGKKKVIALLLRRSVGNKAQLHSVGKLWVPPTDFFGRIQRLEDTSFTKEDARAMEAERKEEARAMEARLEARMDKAEARMQENFLISTFLTIVSLFTSLAANEKFVAKFFPQR